MSKAAYRTLVLVFLVLPVWLVGYWLGLFPSIGETAFASLGVGTAVVIIPVIAAATLTIAALRSVERDPRLSEPEKRKWRDFIFFLQVVAAILYFQGRFREEETHARTDGAA